MAAQTLIPSPNPNPNPMPEASKPESEASEPSTSSPSPSPSIHRLCFNQDAGCFSAATSSGFRIFNSDPILQMFHRERHISFTSVEMLFRSSIFAIVGGGGPHHQHYPPNKVMIWNDYEIRCIGELSLRSEIRSVRLRRDRIIAITDRQVLVHNFADFRLLHDIETVPNPKGLCAVSQQIGSFVLVCLGVKKGQVRVEHYGDRGRRTRLIMAHDSRIACLELSRDARLVATASSKGTLVRVFSTGDGTLLQEVRRGADRAEIYSIAFSENLQYLAVSSDKGTVHVFSLKINLGLTANDTPCHAPDLNIPTTSSSLSFIKGVLPKYFSSEWSVAQFRLHEGSQYIVSFGHQKNTVIVLGMDGSFYRCEFDPNIGGEMKQLECYNFLKLGGTF